MKPFERAVRDTINQYKLITGDETILVAVSGGPDSTALLALLIKLFSKRVKAAAYIDHQLRPDETAAERVHVEQLCHDFGIPFAHASVDVPQAQITSDESPEACARRLRFAALEKLMKKHQASLLALGHTRDDQVEEILIRLIRGSGMNGLSGMRYRNNHIIRPLLNSSKQEILAYLAATGLSFCLDSSNESRSFLRNKIRLDLLPLLEKEFNPAIQQTLLNSATIFKDEDKYLDDRAQRLYHQIVRRTEEQSADRRQNYRFTIDSFCSIPLALKRRVLEKLFWQSGTPSTFLGIEKALALHSHGKTGSSLHFSGGMRVIKTSEEIIFCSRPGDKNKRLRQNEAFEDEFIFHTTGTILITQLGLRVCIESIAPPKTLAPKTLYIDGDQVSFPIVLRAPVPGECFHPLGAPGRKKVARYFSDKKIPKHQRHKYPVLVSEGIGVIGILGLEISERVKLSERTGRVLKIFQENLS